MKSHQPNLNGNMYKIRKKLNKTYMCMFCLRNKLKNTEDKKERGVLERRHHNIKHGRLSRLLLKLS